MPAPLAREAHVVVDLGFGDAGKGAVTDYLVRQRRAHTVVRFNGGAQAGHNVVTPDGRHHTFSQFGSGSFVPGVATHLAGSTVVHPTALLVEAEALARAGVGDALARLTVDQDALVITPLHQAAGRLRELARGDARHGSCGVGVGEAKADSIAHPDEAVRVRDLRDEAHLRRVLGQTRERKLAELSSEGALSGAPAARERALLESREAGDDWIAAVRSLARGPLVVDGGWLGDRLAAAGAVVFEGAQGVLLDERFGFHPFTTWSTCTCEGAAALLDSHGYDEPVTRLGVVRSYAVRHGPGPFPTEAPELERHLPEPHNASGPWQGSFRRGWPDLALLQYALDVSPVDALAVTHLDAIARVRRWKVGRGYHGGPGVDPALFDTDPTTGRCRRVRRVDGPGLDHQSALARSLGHARPALDEVEPGDDAPGWWASLAEEVGVRMRLGFEGPTARHARLL